MLKSSKLRLIKKLGSFSFVLPVFYAPLVTQPCHYIVNHYVKIWHMRLGDANNRHPLSWGGAQTEKIQKLIQQFVVFYVSLKFERKN